MKPTDRQVNIDTPQRAKRTIQVEIQQLNEQLAKLQKELKDLKE